MIRIRTKIGTEHRVLTTQNDDGLWITLISKVYPEWRGGSMEARSLREAGQNHLTAANNLRNKVRSIKPGTEPIKRCRFEGGENEQVSCETCRKEMGLEPLSECS